MGNLEHHDISKALQERILVLDGAMGTMIQRCGIDAKGNNEALNCSHPEAIANIHRQYIEAGADIITTNTFNVGADLPLVAAGAQLARAVADEASRPVWVAGTMGPTNKSLSMASDMNVPESRAIDFDEMAHRYRAHAAALLDGGVDVLLIETCYDVLNCKAALYAISQLEEERGQMVPVMVSATINDRSGRTLTGQTLDAFYHSICHYPILSFGLNCSFGVVDLRPFIEKIAATVPCYVSIYPNAGLPNAMGDYDELPEFTARHIGAMAKDGLINIAGGCCGTTPEHISAIAEVVKHAKPRPLKPQSATLTVTGLESVEIEEHFVNIGERTNVAGSRKFARLIGENNLEEATAVARNQIENGAFVIDINMDDAMLDSAKEMRRFVRHIMTEPTVARAALMIDSSHWPTILEGLKNAQGKCIVNSISLKEGEEAFLSKARQLHKFGAAVVVMAFDEQGQATTYERKIDISQRAYNLLTQKAWFAPQDIILDVNVLTIGTGMDEHANYAVDFINAVRWIKTHLPGAKTSGGVSNLSFAFRGNNPVREAMHSAFLYHAIKAGLDMAIINPAMLQVYDEIEPSLLKAVEDVIFNTDPEATERLMQVNCQQPAANSPKAATQAHQGSFAERLSYALTHGVSDNLKTDIAEALEVCGSAVAVIEGPLMQGMERVGQLFGEGKMFLPQVVKSAKIMKQAVALLPLAHQQPSTLQPSSKIVIATANGDVHDIGKNIVSIVLSCNNFEVIDLGVMVPNEKILEVAKREKPCLVCVSGLITPSLKEMEQLCALFEREGMTTPIIVGGATTSAIHTAVKLAPQYTGGVIYGGDASTTSVLAKKFQANPEQLLLEIKSHQELLRNKYFNRATELVAYADANQARRTKELHVSLTPVGAPSIADVEPLIDWHMLLRFWGFKQGDELLGEAQETLKQAQEQLAQIKKDRSISLDLCFKIFNAHSEGNNIVATEGVFLPMLRRQSGACECLADFLPSEGTAEMGLFCIVAKDLKKSTDEGEHLMRHALCARLTEAAAQWLENQQQVVDCKVIRPAFGYSACPDHSLKQPVIEALGAKEKLGITLTENYSIIPSTAICGILIAHPEAHYFAVGKIDQEQFIDYCQRHHFTEEAGKKFLNQNLQG